MASFHVSKIDVTADVLENVGNIVKKVPDNKIRTNPVEILE